MSAGTQLLLGSGESLGLALSDNVHLEGAWVAERM